MQSHSCNALRPRAHARIRFLRALTWVLALMNSVRIGSCFPTLWVICSSGDSSQHSLLARMRNLVRRQHHHDGMAAVEQQSNGGPENYTAAISTMDAALCLATMVVIIWHGSLVTDCVTAP